MLFIHNTFLMLRLQSRQYAVGDVFIFQTLYHNYNDVIINIFLKSAMK